MGILATARKGFNAVKSISKGYGGSFGGIWGFPFAQGVRNWNREAGLRYDNSAVFAGIMFAIGAMTEVDIFVERPDSSGAYKEVTGHPITQLLETPNPWYDQTTLMSGWIMSELTAAEGCSYTYKHRSSAGKLIALEYVPHFAIRPWVKPGSGNFIDEYWISIHGGIQPEKPQDILQQRFGPIDPLHPQVSYGPLNPVLLSVVNDNEALNFVASLLFNVGVTPHLISPALKDYEGKEIIFNEEQRQIVEEAFSKKITRNNRGNPLVSPLPIKVDNLSLDPAAMNLDAIHNLSEERISAVLRIPPLCLNLGTGIEQQNNRASADAAFAAGARSFTKPYMKKKGLELTRDLVPELGQPGDRVRFRVEAIEALQEDKTETAKRDQIEVQSFMTVNEKRKQKGLPPIPGGDTIIWPKGSAPEAPDDSLEDEEDPEEGGKPTKSKK